jgi:hypothetical protein
MRAFKSRKIISIMLIGLMTVGCGKAARLERLERERTEIAAEQARVDKLGRQKGVWERFSNNTWTYVIGTAAFVAVVGVGALIYHRHKKAGIPTAEENPNDQSAEVQQEEAHQVPQPEHFEENAQFPPPAQEQNHIDNIPAQEAQNQIMQPQAENVLQLQIQQINEHQEVVAQMQHEAPPAENIQEPEIHNDGMQIIPDEHQAQNPQQNFEVANNAAIPQQDLEPTAEELRLLYGEQRLAEHRQWWSEDRQLWMAERRAGPQQLSTPQRLMLDAFVAVLAAESQVKASPYAHNSVKHMILIHRWNIAFGQWEATHLANIVGYTTPNPKKMPTLIDR